MKPARLNSEQRTAIVLHLMLLVYFLLLAFALNGATLPSPRGQEVFTVKESSRCLTPPLPPLPSPKLPIQLKSPRAAGDVVNAVMVRAIEVVPPKRYWLTWKADEYNRGPVAFDVERKLTMTSPWVKLMTVDAPPVEITQYPGYFRVGVHWK